jgi:predicted nucleic acid-binding protein
MGSGYLIDSNVVIDFLNDKLVGEVRDLIFNIEPTISFITQIEIFSTAKITEKEKLSLLIFVNQSVIYRVDNDIIEETINIRLANKIKLPDAIIAATAKVNNLILITRNTKDFKNIKGITLIDPYSL